MDKHYLEGELFTRWTRLVSNAHHVVIMGHAGPDGDAIGSTLALAHYLQGLGKQVSVIMPNLFPDFLAWLPGAKDIINYEYARGRVRMLFSECDLAFCLDFNALSRLEDLSQAASHIRAPKILIDHHLSPEHFANLEISDASVCSTCELVFCLLSELGAFPQMTTDCATCLYCGMMTDTGAFTYNSNRSQVFYIISQLLTKGIDKDRIYRQVYHNYSVNRVRLMGYILSQKMIYFEEEHTSLFTLTCEEMKQYQFRKGDAEGLVNIPLQIKNTRLSISLREDTEKPLIRVSLRSVDDFPCNRMSEDFFNGGGHLNASGGSLPMTMDEAVAQVRRAIDAYRPLLTQGDKL